jgi:acetyl-CoA synthetase
MGMTPELPIAMLACARIKHRIRSCSADCFTRTRRPHPDSQAVAVITQDGFYRRGSEVKSFPAVEEGLRRVPA